MPLMTIIIIIVHYVYASNCLQTRANCIEILNCRTRTACTHKRARAHTSTGCSQRDLEIRPCVYWPYLGHKLGSNMEQRHFLHFWTIFLLPFSKWTFFFFSIGNLWNRNRIILETVVPFRAQWKQSCPCVCHTIRYYGQKLCGVIWNTLYSVGSQLAAYGQSLPR